MNILAIGPIIEMKLQIWLEYNTEAIPKILIPKDLFPEERISGWVTGAYCYVSCSYYDGQDILIITDTPSSLI